MSHATKMRVASLGRRTINSVSLGRRSLDHNQELVELWQRYRPLQSYLDSIPSKSAVELLQCSRCSVVEVLSERFPDTEITLDGDVVLPLGLELV